MPIGYGGTTSKGVRWIKVNRYDSDGSDRSNYLGQLQSITLTYPDRSAIEYPILSLQEQANYYIYGIASGYNTSSRGNINDYSFLANNSSDVISKFSTPFPSTPGDYYIGLFGTVTGNTLGYFSDPGGTYTLGDTPNKQLKVQFSGSATTSAAGSFRCYVALKNDRPVAFADINNGGGTFNFNTTIYLTSSFNGGTGMIGSNELIEGNSLVFNVWSSNQDITIDAGDLFVSFSLYDATPFNGSSSIAIFNPYPLNFDYNDYNPLLDNAEVPQYSTTWMDVDYSQNPVTPINFSLIISGTADRAFVQDSNYSSKAWSNIRYNGSRTNSFRNI